MMFADVDGQRQLARPNEIARCPNCDGTLVAKCGEIRIWHWAHVASTDSDPWSEPESEWHLGWKKHLPDDRTEVVIDRGGKRHRADIIAKNGAVLEQQASSIPSQEIQEREAFYKHMAWLYRVTWAERLHYGKKGFWWKQGALAQTFITKPLFWEFEEEGIIQSIKLKRLDSNRVVGRADKTYSREQFVNFVKDGVVPEARANPHISKRQCLHCKQAIQAVLHLEWMGERKSQKIVEGVPQRDALGRLTGWLCFLCQGRR